MTQSAPRRTLCHVVHFETMKHKVRQREPVMTGAGLQKWSDPVLPGSHSARAGLCAPHLACDDVTNATSWLLMHTAGMPRGDLLCELEAWPISCVCDRKLFPEIRNENVSYL
ncbi:hypothetical protein Pelo_19590 [Pelomyxa schiedti]|nr:hypothetical protein Pelo_19590 [Pelomyxa schiedti]